MKQWKDSLNPLIKVTFKIQFKVYHLLKVYYDLLSPRMKKNPELYLASGDLTTLHTKSQ